MKTSIIGCAFFLRLGFIYYGICHDQLMEVAYTDIDYSVFTDAAKQIYDGKSPYEIETYKYTPLLAQILLPNVCVNILFGKILFSVFDIVVALILFRICVKSMSLDGKQSETLIAILWLFNPFTMTISSRGNAEGMQIFLVTSCLLLVVEKKLLLAGFMYGLSVHFKLYPVIYALPILLKISKLSSFLNNERSWYGNLKSVIFSMLQRDVIKFAMSSLLSFVGFGYIMYHWYGMQFIENTYLFHFLRKDTQHNFSPYFYILHITDGWLVGDVINKMVFLPQLVAVVTTGVAFHEQVPLACFLQTFAFVTFNKVCTSQYFIWYIGLLPLAYPFMEIPIKESLKMLVVWLLSQAVWLFFAYLFEFRKYNVLFLVWLSSLVFWVVNMFILLKLVKYATNFKQKHPKTN